MGQYYLALLLSSFLPEGQTRGGPEIIRLALSPHAYDDGACLTEHSYVTSEFVETLEYQLTPEGLYHKCRVVWAGDYADPEPNGKTLYDLNANPSIHSLEHKPLINILRENLGTAVFIRG